VARASAAAALDDRLAGERVTVLGSVQAPGSYEGFVRYRHLAGRLVVDTVVGWRPGDPASTAANGLRRTLATGADGLPERQRSLLAGLTLGDDRAQPPDMTEAFRAAGLTHLLAVSGQNIAFVLAIVAPLLSRLSFGPRLAATLTVLAGFALVTRAEPSVLRAAGMAAVAAVGVAAGRPASTLRTLALGVTAMVLVDPLLTTSLGFRLSVLGAGGIVVGAGRLERRLPGPRWLAAPLAVTVSAQAAVSPLLVATFGSVPLASIPANLLAAPAAGPIMVWGLTGGLAAGVVGGPVARLLHLPTGVLLGWLDGVATAAARWPLGDLRGWHLVALALAAALATTGPRRSSGPTAPTRRHGSDGRGGRSDAGGRPSGDRWRARRAAAGVAVAAATLASATASAARAGPDLAGLPLGVGAEAWRAGGAVVVVVDGRARPASVLEGLRRARVHRLHVIVVRTASHGALDVAVLLRQRWRGSAVLVPRSGQAPAAARPALAGAYVPAPGTTVALGGVRLRVTEVTERLVVDLHLARAPPPVGRGSHRPGPAAAGPILGARAPAPPAVAPPGRRRGDGRVADRDRRPRAGRGGRAATALRA
jgi:competence protein ComEC